MQGALETGPQFAEHGVSFRQHLLIPGYFRERNHEPRGCALDRVSPESRASTGQTWFRAVNEETAITFHGQLVNVCRQCGQPLGVTWRK